MKKIVLVRHFPTEYNHTGYVMGDSIDAPISIHSVKGFDDESLEIINECEVAYTSPAKRSQETARILFDCPIIIDERIRPRGIGDWGGYSLAQIQEVCQEAVYTKEGRLFYNLAISPPNTESLKEVLNRLISFLGDIVESSHRTIGIIVHSMTGIALFALMHNSSFETATFDYSIDFYKTYSISLNQSLLDDMRKRIEESYV